MKAGIYIGSSEVLKGERALLLPDQHTQRLVWAQFDRMSLRYEGKMVGFGWHVFHAFEFKQETGKNDESNPPL